MKKKILITAFFACLFGLCASNAQAELIQISLTATVGLVQDPGNHLEGKITNGSTITGYYTYESATLDSNPSSTVGEYWHYSSPAGVSLSLGGFEFKTDSDSVNFHIGISNHNPGGGDDIYSLYSYNNIPLSNGATVNSIAWQLNDLTGSVFSSDALPVSAPILNQWQYNNLQIQGEEGTPDSYFINANVTLVPEPSTLLLLMFGGGMLLKRYNHISS
jgi:hypothetical protein